MLCLYFECSNNSPNVKDLNTVFFWSARNKYKETFDFVPKQIFYSFFLLIFLYDPNYKIVYSTHAIFDLFCFVLWDFLCFEDNSWHNAFKCSTTTYVCLCMSVCACGCYSKKKICPNYCLHSKPN